MGTKPSSKREVSEKLSGHKLTKINISAPKLTHKNLHLQRKEKSEAKSVKEPLTPLHRLKKFKAIRDRNLTRAVLKKKMDGNTSKGETQVATMPVNLPAMSVAMGASVGDEIANMKSKLVQKMNGETKEEAINDQKREEKKKEKTEDKKKEKVGDKKKEEKVEENKKEEKKVDKKKEKIEEKKEEKLENGVMEEEEVVKEEKKEAIVQEEEEEVDVEGEVDVDEQLKVLRKTLSPEEKAEQKEKDDLEERIKSLRRASASRISGRRSMRAQATPFRKRKASVSDSSEEDNEGTPRPEKQAKWTDVPSPGWRYFATPFKLLQSSTPFKRNVNDSMVVNYDDRTIRQDPQDDEEEDIQTQPVPKSRWFCSLM